MIRPCSASLQTGAPGERCLLAGVETGCSAGLQTRTVNITAEHLL